MRIPGRLVALCVVATMLLSGCSLDIWGGESDRGTLAQPDGSTTPWRDCADRAQAVLNGLPTGVSFSCATLRVPQNWTQPDGKTFSIDLMRVRRDLQDDRIGSLVVNPGGPGGSGIELAAQASLFLPEKLQHRFDIIGFDPRGVGSSSPIRCISNKQKDEQSEGDPTPDTKEWRKQIRQAIKIGEQCRDKYGSILKRYNTEQTARDMDAIRSAVGDKGLSYLGYSYGTLLGSVYAKLFPTKIRVMALDGAVDPELDGISSAEQQAAGFEKAFDAFAQDCRRRGGDCPIGPDPRAVMRRILRSADDKPARAKDGRKATEGTVALAAISAMYSQERWALLADALHKLDTEGKTDGIFSLVNEFTGRDKDGHYDNSGDAQLAISCTDDEKKVSTDRIAQLRAQWQDKYPLFGATLASTLLGCSQWKGGHDPYETGKAVSAPPIVVVGTTGDPATPYANSERLAKLLGTATVLTWEGEGHTAFPQSGCITDAVNAYLIDLRVPDTGARCD